MPLVVSGIWEPGWKFYVYRASIEPITLRPLRLPERSRRLEKFSLLFCSRANLNLGEKSAGQFQEGWLNFPPPNPVSVGYERLEAAVYRIQLDIVLIFFANWISSVNCQFSSRILVESLRFAYFQFCACQCVIAEFWQMTSDRYLKSHTSFLYFNSLSP